MTQAVPVELVERCPVCGSPERARLFAASDDRYGHVGRYWVAECRACGLGYLEERPLASAIADLYRRHYPKAVPSVATTPGGSVSAKLRARIGRSPLWVAYQRVVNRVNVYGHVRGTVVHVLDVGSGFALDGARWLTRHRRASWTSLDVNPDVCRWVAERGFEAVCDTLEGFASRTIERFDYVLMSQVIEHVYHPVAFLRAARAVLRGRGRVVIACPNYDSVFRLRFGRRWLHWHVPYHVSHFSPRSLATLAAGAGLEVERWMTVTPAAWYDVQSAMLDGAHFEDIAMRTPPLRQLRLDAALWTENHTGRGDALVAVLRARVAHEVAHASA